MLFPFCFIFEVKSSMFSTKKGSRQKFQTRKQKKSLVNGIVTKANKIRSPLNGLEEFKSFQNEGLDLSIDCCKATEASSETKIAIFDLLKNNMKELYENSSWGWKEETKLEELYHEDAWYLVGREQDKIVAFSHFRFEVEESYPILYCYELQIASSIQRKGIGKYFMKILALIANNLRLVKVILTVFKHNQPAMDFYLKSLGFRLDETSPREAECCYVILSRSTEKKT